jgi:hypothetical protein
MENAYGNAWQTLVIVKPKETRPFWTLKELFKCFKKHWIAVFSLIDGLYRSHERLFDDLNSIVCKRTFWDNLNDDEKSRALEIASKILNLFQNRPYGSTLQPALVQIHAKIYYPISFGLMDKEKPSPQVLQQRNVELQKPNEEPMMTDGVRGRSLTTSIQHIFRPHTPIF